MQPKNRFRIAELEERIAPAITISSIYVKEPGPTDTVVTTATNPAGNAAVGQQGTTTVHNSARH